MGQCAPSSPSSYWPTSIDDDEIPIVVSSANNVACYGELPLQRIFSQNDVGEYSNKHPKCRLSNDKFDKKQQHNFLQAHQPDIAQRRLIDQNDIKKTVWLQSDELLRRNGKLKMHGMSVDEIRGEQKSPFHENEIHARCHNEEQTNRGISKRRQCMPVLQLKIKARVGWFYTHHYLKMFPNELKPIIGTFPESENGIPGLACESSDCSFTSNSSSSSSSSSSSNNDSYCARNGFIPPITPIKCPITNESLFDLAITGCLGLVPRGQDHDALRSSRRQLRDHCRKNDHCIALVNKRSGSLLAVCALKESSGPPAIRIYAARQMSFGQRHETTTKQLGLDWVDEMALYAWAEVKTEGDFPDMNVVMFLVQRFDGCFSSQPCYKASFDGHSTGHDSGIHSPVVTVLGKTDSERHMSGCALIWIQKDELMARTHSENRSDLYFRINIAQGIDPALLICFTAIVDEILEKSMRTRCHNQAKGLIRKDSFSLTKKRLQEARRSRVQLAVQMTGDAPCKAELCPHSNCIF